MRRLMLVLFILLFGVSTACADVVKTVSTEYYPVDGHDPKNIFDNLKHHSPLNEGSSTYQAHTRTDLRYSFKWRHRGKQCSPEQVTVYLHLTYLYPKLIHSVDYATRKWWKKFMIKLEEHELIHGEISIKAAHELDDVLEAFPPTDCASFKEVVKRRATRILDRMKRDQQDYDKLTQHGLKQERNMGRYPR
ncbi:DUF922 domain-containing protein [Pseudodesulfovibrio sp. JC047]|uniref:DUF922 domain-containing Zn-dependent protease n=1 Tax=Pseudodesulfovibrio sp. JC047 TaxID=2683199 RepID=UPI0013D14A3B|nr:DUF922 domain-containing Zn-dependent protease [Pseudodesulfovibrio sp. JC047]NDV19031.1 DUF922 domain-containing protein [Pseudodesulfovibrio sp. JC047]